MIPTESRGRRLKPKGLGLLDVETVLVTQKTVLNREAKDARSGMSLSGYEIHMGRTNGPDTLSPMITLDGKPDGAVSQDGRIRGCYMHGLFSTDEWRQDYLSSIGIKTDGMNYRQAVDDALDALADHLESVVDPSIFDICA